METTVNKIEIIEPNKEIKPIVTDELSIANGEEPDTKWIISALSSHKVLDKYGGSFNEYLADNLVNSLENAMAPDNKGTLHIDYKTRLRTMEKMIQLVDKSFWQNQIQVNFFSSPKKLNH